MTPSEVKRMKSDECIILLGGQFPILTKKRQQLESCMNYDIAKEIKDSHPSFERHTKDTYRLGRSYSEGIRKIQDKARAEELAFKEEIEKIDKMERVDSKNAAQLRNSVVPLEKTPNLKGVGGIVLQEEIYKEEELEPVW